MLLQDFHRGTFINFFLAKGKTILSKRKRKGERDIANYHFLNVTFSKRIIFQKLKCLIHERERERKREREREKEKEKENCNNIEDSEFASLSSEQSN